MKKIIYNLTFLTLSLFIFSATHAQKKLMAEYGESNVTGQFAPFDSTLYSYNSLNLVQTQLRKLIISGNWKNYSKNDYTYNSSNQQETQVYSGFDNGSWNPLYKYSYTYSGGMLNESIEARRTNGIWRNEYHEFYTYNGNKVDTVFRKKIDSTGVESDYKKTAYTYTGTGKLAQMLTFELKNGNWEEMVKWTYAYDGADRLVKQEEENMLPGGWYKVHYYSFSYDNDGLLRNHAHKVSSNNSDIGRAKYIYEGDAANVSAKETVNTISVTAYPNPAQNQFTIAWQTEGVFNFILMDINGKIINTITDITTGKVEMNNLGMQAGLYLYTLTSADGNYYHTGRLTKQ